MTGVNTEFQKNLSKNDPGSDYLSVRKTILINRKRVWINSGI